MFTLLALSLTVSPPASAQDALMPAPQSALVLMGTSGSRYEANVWEDTKLLMWSGLPMAMATPEQAWLLRSEGQLALVALDADGREIRRWTELDAVAQLHTLAALTPSTLASR